MCSMTSRIIPNMARPIVTPRAQPRCRSSHERDQPPDATHWAHSLLNSRIVSLATTEISNDVRPARGGREASIVTRRVDSSRRFLLSMRAPVQRTIPLLQSLLASCALVASIVSCGGEAPMDVPQAAGGNATDGSGGEPGASGGQPGTGGGGSSGGQPGCVDDAL